MKNLLGSLAFVGIGFWAVGCGSEVVGDASQGAGGDGAGGSGPGGQGGEGGDPFDDPTDCVAIDVTCPEARPSPGAGCKPGLTCEYPEEMWSYECEADGTWSGSQNCDMLIGGACNVPPSAEACSQPTTTGVTGSVATGPADGEAFRAFTDGEHAHTEVGPQGSGMLFYRVALDSNVLPTCVEITTTLLVEGADFPEQQTRSVRLRCGESELIYSFLPYLEQCPTGLVNATLTIEIAGVGSTTASIQINGADLCVAQLG